MAFTRMDESTQQDWIQIGIEHAELQKSVPDRILAMLRELKAIEHGFATDQLHHALQTATMAERAGADDEMIVASLCHDIGKVVSVPNHDAIAGEILRPYVSDQTYHLIRVHQDFQGKHYYEYMGKAPDAREQYRAEPWFDAAAQFADEWDQAAFDPDYPVESLEHFEPLVRDLFAAPRR